MVMKKPPVTISPSDGVPGRASEPSQDGFGVDGRDGTFRGWRPIDLGFSRREAIYRRKGEVGGCPRGPHHA